MAFKETDFEWEFLQPRGSPTHETSMDFSCYASESHGEDKAVPSLNEIRKTVDIHGEQVQLCEEELFVEELDDGGQSTAFMEEEEDALDWGLESLLYKGEEDEDKEEEEDSKGKKMVACTETEINEKNSRNALDLKKWLRSIGVAAATLSIIILGRGRGRNWGKFTGNNKKIQFPICTKDEKIKDFVQNQGAISPPFGSWASYNEWF
ncbi:hypothetical protein HPP92_020370 [Vanilla planifolia]|uniref:DUF6821 domain-containing protein n=1 Tax=Vanilla planifolia TaxID=51239 RepID=A0A835Q154_VANPL|nr:hypothetical protein HPP92_020370 [Vanilla planifolia]